MSADFDTAAAAYDRHFTHSVIGTLQRKRVYQHLSNALKNPIVSVLEINCGTGEDAVWLARKGLSVTATDISENMLAVAKGKKTTENLHFEQADINTLDHTFPEKKFDLIFSNFGGLNCLSEIRLELFFKNASELLSENGLLFLVIMPKNTIWEQCYFLLKGKFSEIFRRKRESVLVDVDGEKVLTFYYNPKETVILADTYFTLRQLNPIGFFIPPSYLEPFLKERKKLASVLDRFETRITNRSFLAKYADHYSILFQKR